MEGRAFKVFLPKNPQVSITVIPGHFATVNSHVNHYLDMSDLKTNSLLAKDVARELALPYLNKRMVDTIICMDSTEIIGAYLAEELLARGSMAVSEGKGIQIITPMSNVDGKLVFQTNVMKMILNKDIVLLVDSVSSGRTIDSAKNCMNFYGGRLVGISALFCAEPEKSDPDINTMFTSADILNYQFYQSGECRMCRAGQKLDAIVNTEGYMKI